MRLMLWIIAGLSALYAAYWALAARAIHAEAERTLAAMRVEGTGDAATVGVAGFPARFEVTVDAPRLVSPDGAFGWSAPGVTLHALSYRPQHVIAIFPPEQTLSIGRETVAVTSSDLSASAVFGLSASAPLARAQAVGERIALASDAGWGVTAEAVRAAVRRGASETEQEIGVEATGLGLSGLPARIATAGGALPSNGERFYLDAMLDLDRPLDLHAAGGVRIRAADIRAVSLDWGPAGISGKGAVALTPSGQPEGRIELSLRNWRAALTLAGTLGVVRAETAPTVERALAGLAALDGDPDVLSLPLVFAGGRMSLGPIPLGPAPRF